MNTVYLGLHAKHLTKERQTQMKSCRSFFQPWSAWDLEWWEADSLNLCTLEVHVPWLGHCFSHMLSCKNCSPFFDVIFNACKSIFKRIALHKALHVVSSHRNPKLKRIRVHTNGPAACRTGNRWRSRAADQAMSNASGQRTRWWRDGCSDIMTCEKSLPHGTLSYSTGFLTGKSLIWTHWWINIL